MEITDAISTEEMKSRLQNLEEHLPDGPQFIHDFGAYLATRLNPKLDPIGFSMMVQLTISDLQEGVDGFTRKPVPHSLSGQLATVYTQLEMNIPLIARAVCSSDFADKVDEVYAQVHKL